MMLPLARKTGSSAVLELDDDWQVRDRGLFFVHQEALSYSGLMKLDR